MQAGELLHTSSLLSFLRNYLVTTNLYCFTLVHQLFPVKVIRINYINSSRTQLTPSFLVTEYIDHDHFSNTIFFTEKDHLLTRIHPYGDII